MLINDDLCYKLQQPIELPGLKQVYVYRDGDK